MKHKSSHTKPRTPAMQARIRSDKSTRQLPVKLAIGLLSLILALILTEVGLRLLYKKNYARRDDERLIYRHDPERGCFPIQNSRKGFSGSRFTTATHNSKGFRDVEPT